MKRWQSFVIIPGKQEQRAYIWKRTKWWIEEGMIQITAGYLMMARRKLSTHTESYLQRCKEVNTDDT